MELVATYTYVALTKIDFQVNFITLNNANENRYRVIIVSIYIIKVTTNFNKKSV